MALPTVQKDWQFDLDRVIESQASGTAQAAEIFLAIKAALVGFELEPWIVVGSSDGTDAGMDEVDRLEVAADIVNSTGAHSWIVLEQPATGIQIVLDWNNNTGKYLCTRKLSVSGGFTGGDTSNRPTASDEAPLSSVWSWCGGNTTGRRRIHVLHSEDGKLTYIFQLYRGLVATFGIIGEAGDPVTGWTYPYVCLFDGIDALNDGYSKVDFLLNFGTTFAGYHGAAMVMQMTGEGTGLDTGDTRLLTDVAKYHEEYAEDEDVPQALLLEMGLMSYTTGRRGHHGKLTDFWRTNTGIPSGSVFRDQDRAFAVLGGWVVPWPSDTPVLVS